MEWNQGYQALERGMLTPGDLDDTYELFAESTESGPADGGPVQFRLFTRRDDDVSRGPFSVHSFVLLEAEQGLSDSLRSAALSPMLGPEWSVQLAEVSGPTIGDEARWLEAVFSPGGGMSLRMVVGGFRYGGLVVGVSGLGGADRFEQADIVRQVEMLEARVRNADPFE